MKKEFTTKEIDWLTAVFVLIVLLIGLFGSGIISVILAVLLAYIVAVEPDIGAYKLLVTYWIASVRAKVWK